MTSYQPIELRKLTPKLGAEIAGVDLTAPLDPRTVDEIRQALVQNGVIYLRDQKLSAKQLIEFGRHFGDLFVHPAGADVEYPEITRIYADEHSTRISGEEWHVDASFAAEPPMGTILNLEEMPAGGGGDTLFASMYSAYDALSDAMKTLLIGLTATHSGEVLRGRYNADDGATKYAETEHPVVCAHPVSGRKLLYVNQIYTTRVVQLKPKESAALLAFLFAHVGTPEFQCRVTWQENSIAFWDNRCVQHRGVWDYYPDRRCGKRVQIKGTRPISAC